jgi:hypothetical protein
MRMVPKRFKYTVILRELSPAAVSELWCREDPPAGRMLLSVALAV